MRVLFSGVRHVVVGYDAPTATYDVVIESEMLAKRGALSVYKVSAEYLQDGLDEPSTSLMPTDVEVGLR